MQYIHTVLYFAMCQVTLAQSGGVFVAADSMTTPRVGHTATLLENGDVLIAGGYNASGSSNAEIYDAATGRFTAIGPMINAFSRNIAPLLADGRVLLVGSYGQGVLYDPSTRTLTVTANGQTAHACAATLLGNGKVLFTDDPPPYGPSATAEVYDPDTGGFSPTGPYASTELARLDHAVAPGLGGWDCRRATLLADGTVLVAGGVAAEIYDPHTNAFSLTGTMTTFGNAAVTTLPPAWHDPSNATLLLNGMVFFSSGDGDLGPSSEAWLYNPASGAFLKTGAMNTAPNLNPPTLLPDGTVLITGGRVASAAFNGAISLAESYNPAAGKFFSIGEMTTPPLGPHRHPSRGWQRPDNRGHDWRE